MESITIFGLFLKIPGGRLGQLDPPPQSQHHGPGRKILTFVEIEPWQRRLSLMVYIPLACFPISHKNGFSEAHNMLKKYFFDGTFNNISDFLRFQEAAWGHLTTPSPPQNH